MPYSWHMVTPSLSTPQRETFDAFFAAGCDLAALGKSLGTPVSDLLDWASTPAVADRLADLHRFAESALALRLTLNRSAALATLGEVARSSPNLVERRRAATSILRGPWTGRAEKLGPASPEAPPPTDRLLNRPRSPAKAAPRPHGPRSAPPHPSPVSAEAPCPPLAALLALGPSESDISTTRRGTSVRLSPAGALAARAGLVPDSS